MAATDDVDAIAADSQLSVDAKRTRIGARRAEAAHAAVLAGGFPTTFDLGGYRVTITAGRLKANVVELAGIEAWRGATRVPVDTSVRWVNPPLLVADPVGLIARGQGARYREDPGAIILRDLLELIRAADR